MVTRAVARYLRISTRKTQKVIGLLRGLPVLKAEIILNTISKRPTGCVSKLLDSALDSADKIHHLTPADLYISLIKADPGPMLKRYRAASMGRATPIKHRTTHLTLELDRIKRPEKRIVEKQTVEPAKKIEAKAKKTRLKKATVSK